MSISEKRERYLIVVLASIITLISILFFAHTDCYIIVTWGKLFNTCLFNGNMHDFAALCEKEIWSNDYSAICNIILAIIVLPISVIEFLFNQKIAMPICILYFKLILLIFGFLTLKVIFSILEKRGYEQKDLDIYGILFWMSPYMQITCFAMGQIDIISLFCAVYSMELWINNKQKFSALLMLIGIMLKPFFIIICLPIVIYCIYQHRPNLKNGFISIVTMLILLIVNKIADATIFSDYMAIRKGFSNKSMAELFKMTYNFSPFFFCYILVLFVYVLAVISSKVGEKEVSIAILINSALMAMFIQWHPQWFVTCLPIVAYVCIVEIQRDVKEEMMIPAWVYLSVFWAQMVTFIVAIVQLYDTFDVKLVGLGVMSSGIKLQYTGHLLREYQMGLFHYISEFCFSIFCVSFILLSYCVWKNKTVSKKICGNCPLDILEHNKKILFALFSIPTLIWQVSSLLLYFRNVL